jgi:hypothetical protein
MLFDLYSSGCLLLLNTWPFEKDFIFKFQITNFGLMAIKFKVSSCSLAFIIVDNCA